ncbi:hypothetical protein [Tateyamaria pelophila]|uniref:hypothetical protein n=1 Tax=Tateyamaria pelophila TaxID=328415 RepID=UPI001CBFB3BA|nr:hypothetical protein [Tateyamaria pelophila]
MSAPNTNVDKQKRKHRPVLIGLVVVVFFALIVFVLNMSFSVDGEGPLDAVITDDAPVLKNDP